MDSQQSLLDPPSPLHVESDVGTQLSASSPHPVTQLTEQDLKASGAALQAFSDGRFSEAARWLTGLAEVRPNDSLVKLNLLLANLKCSESSASASVCEYARPVEAEIARLMEGNDFEPSDYPVAMYNLSLAKLLVRDVPGALETLRQLQESFEKNGLKPGDDLEPRLRELQLSTLLHGRCTRQALLSLARAGEVTPADGDRAPKLVTNRFWALLQARQLKTFKRDIKLGTSLTGRDLSTFEFMRANVEYLKGNHRKATKLMHGAANNGTLLPQEGSESPRSNKLQSLNSDPLNRGLAKNNIGCALMALGRHQTASLHFAEALEEHVAVLNEPPIKNQRGDFLMQVRKAEIVYNLGMSFLHRGEFQKAYDTLKSTLAVFKGNPHVWMHMAECCIQENTNKEEDFKEMTSKKDSSMPNRDIPGVRVFGVGDNRKLSLTSAPSPSRSSNQSSNSNSSNTSSPINSDRGNSELTLPRAAACLRTAAYLIFGLENNSGGSSQASTRPVSFPLTPKLTLLKAWVLVKQSYVALRLENHAEALNFAEEVLGLSLTPPDGVVALAKLYAAEALVFLDKISQALELLDPNSIKDVSFEDSSKDEDSGASRKKVDAAEAWRLKCTKAVMSYNLSVAYLLRGELDKAEMLLDKLWEERDTHGLGNKVLQARMYTRLKRGGSESCRKLLRDNCASLKDI